MPVWQKLQLSVQPIWLEGRFEALESAEDRVLAEARARGLVDRGDSVVMSGSHPFSEGAATNFLKLSVA